MREGILRTKWLDKKLTAADLWVYPLSENIGLKMDVDDGLRVGSVTPHSPAAGAGIRLGDHLVSLAGQPRISMREGDIIVAVDGKTEPMTESQFIADLRLAHPPRDTVRFTVLRQGKREEIESAMW